MSSGASKYDLQKATQAARIAGGRCRFDANGSHPFPKHGTYCASCYEKYVVKTRERNKSREAGNSEITSQSFWEAMQDLYYAGRL